MKSFFATTLTLLTLTLTSAQRSQYRIEPASLRNTFLASTNTQDSIPQFKGFNDKTVEQVWYLDEKDGGFTLQSLYSDYYLSCNPVERGHPCRLSNTSAIFTSQKIEGSENVRIGFGGKDSDLVLTVEAKGNSRPYAGVDADVGGDDSQSFQLIADPRT